MSNAKVSSGMPIPEFYSFSNINMNMDKNRDKDRDTDRDTDTDTNRDTDRATQLTGTWTRTEKGT